MTQLDSGIVVGCGSIGQRHIGNAAKLGVNEIIGVDKKEKSRKEAKEAGATEVYADLDGALSERSPDFGIVAVPNHLHLQIARELAAAGVDLFIEKPLSHTQEGVNELVNEAEESNLITLVGYNFRFQPGIQKLRELLQDDVVGTPLSVQIEAGSYLPDWHPYEDYREMYSVDPEMGGGAILDYIHELNYCRWLFGEVKKVTAMTASKSHLDIDVEDLAELIFEMKDGTICQIHVDYVQRPSERSCKVVGDEGTLQWDLDRHTVQEYQPNNDKWKTHNLPDWEFNAMYVDELDHFLSCVESRSETVCDLEDGYRDLQAALAALRSAEEGSHIRVDNI